MRILSRGFVQRFAGRLLNIHPSLLPKYKGLDTHARALAAGDTHHGASVHYVTAELDGGPVIMQGRLRIRARGHAGRGFSPRSYARTHHLPACVLAHRRRTHRVPQRHGVLRRRAPRCAAHRGKRCGCLNVAHVFALLGACGAAQRRPRRPQTLSRDVHRRVERHDRGDAPSLELKRAGADTLHLLHRRTRRAACSAWPCRTRSPSRARSRSATGVSCRANVRGHRTRRIARSTSISTGRQSASPALRRKRPVDLELPATARRIRCRCRSPRCATSRSGNAARHGVDDRRRQAQGIRAAARKAPRASRPRSASSTPSSTPASARDSRPPHAHLGGAALGYLPVKAERIRGKKVRVHAADRSRHRPANAADSPR